MNDAWTREPWALDANGWCHETEEHENQPRIVACVNACAGIPTEKLQSALAPATDVNKEPAR